MKTRQEAVTPSGEQGEEWRVEHFTKDGANEWMVVTASGMRTVALSNTNDSRLAEAEMRQIVRDHKAVPALYEALRGLRRVNRKCYCTTWVGGEHEPECEAATAALLLL